MADRTPTGNGYAGGGERSKAMTLEEEVAKKMAAIKISQEDINALKAAQEEAKNSGVDLRNQSPNESAKQLQLMTTRDSKRYEATLYPTYVLQKAYAKVDAVGSATAMIAILNQQ